MNYFDKIITCPICFKELNQREQWSKRCPTCILIENKTISLSHFVVYDDVIIIRAKQIVGTYYFPDKSADYFSYCNDKIIFKKANLSIEDFIQLSSKLENLKAFL